MKSDQKQNRRRFLAQGGLLATAALPGGQLLAMGNCKTGHKEPIKDLVGEQFRVQDREGQWAEAKLVEIEPVEQKTSARPYGLDRREGFYARFSVNDVDRFDNDLLVFNHDVHGSMPLLVCPGVDSTGQACLEAVFN